MRAEATGPPPWWERAEHAAVAGSEAHVSLLCNPRPRCGCQVTLCLDTPHGLPASRALASDHSMSWNAQADDAAEAPDGGSGGEDGAFVPLDDAGVRAYLAGIPKLAQRLGGAAAEWKVLLSLQARQGAAATARSKGAVMQRGQLTGWQLHCHA